MKINLAPGHFDCAGIYFFPSNFKPVNFWRNKPYKFVATMKPSMRVLDLTKLTLEDCKTIAAKAGIAEKYEAVLGEYPPKNPAKAADMLWDELTSYYAFGVGGGKRAAMFNKLFRSMGYDAIFDDIRAIHVAEVQLVVLDPRVIAHVHLEQRKSSGFAAMQKVIDDVVGIAKQYGTVETETPRKTKEYFSSTKQLTTNIKVVRNDDNYAYVKLLFDDKRGEIHLSLKWTKPMLRAGYGASYDISSGEYTNFNGLNDIALGLKKVFEPQIADASV